MLELINFIYPCLALIARYMLAHKMKAAFLIFMLVEISMAYIGIVSRQYGICAMAVMFFVMNIYSYIQWSKTDE